MRIDPAGRLHLTYCTNIHAADGWQAVNASLRRHAPALKRRFSPDRPFGIGLRLSARDARELAGGRHLDAFRRWLDDEGLYVALINGFPFGSFHRATVKADVYAPDWRDEARVAYTIDLARILSRLVPDDVDGGVSTAPLSYKAWMGAGDKAGWKLVTANVARVASAMARLHREHGTLIHLDIEPEPDCCIETTGETIAFFTEHLIPDGAPVVASELGVSHAEAVGLLYNHVRVCFDCCHFSVEHEDPIDAIARIEAAGIRIGRIQLSSALRVEMPGDAAAATEVEDRLRRFADSTYLHQVVARSGDDLRHFPDLGPALDLKPGGPAEWRVHFHVPLFTSEYDGLGSTQDDVRRVIGAARNGNVTTHLEIETYTWDVLPAALKIDLLESIAREYEWVLGVIGDSKRPGRP